MCNICNFEKLTVLKCLLFSSYFTELQIYDLLIKKDILNAIDLAAFN